MSKTGKSKASPKLTPLMQQWGEIKAEHQDKILLFHLGDFYEMFGSDAEDASRVLGITLTKRSKGDGAMPLAGFPIHAAREYIERLLQNGRRVAICDQVEDPRTAKGIVKRAVTRVITPGTLMSDVCGEGLLKSDKNNYLAAIFPSELSDNELCGLAFVDLSTGEFTVAELTRDTLNEELERLAPAEILVPESSGWNIKKPRAKKENPPSKNKLRVQDEDPAPYGENIPTPERTAYHDWAFDIKTAERTLKELFGVDSLDAFGVENLKCAKSAAGALVRYLEETHKAGLSHITGLSVINAQESLAFDGEALRNLEITETIRDRKKDGSLLGVLDHTKTSPGARRLRNWLIRPLASLKAIHLRLDAVSELVNNYTCRSETREHLGNIQDIERLSGKLASGRINARDLLAISSSLFMLQPLAQSLTGTTSDTLSRLRDGFKDSGALQKLAEKIKTHLRPEPPIAIKDGNIISDGISDELDRLRKIRAGGKSWLAEFQAREAKATGIPKLKVGYNKVFGYYLEVSRINAERVPEHYERKQTLVNAERFITPELKEREVEVLGAEDKITALEYELFVALREEVALSLAEIKNMGALISELDALASFAEVAALRGYVRPTVDESTKLDVTGSRHPVLDITMSAGTFVPNDIMLDTETRQLLVVTGPNMAGKSTFIRQVALIAAMAQMGSFVPAETAHVGMVDRIFARVGASDDISRGRSTFMVEMVETARVLRTATERSLVILDEVGRGTSTYDGVSLAWAVTEHLHNVTGARTLFATHYHELCAITDELSRVANVSVSVREWGKKVTFLYRIVEGGADRSYGIHVARLAGVPEEVITRAQQILDLLESRSRAPVESGQTIPAVEQLPLMIPVNAPDEPAEQKPSEVELALEKLNIENLTPVAALLELERLKNLLE